MHIDTEITGWAIVALAIFAHGWQSRIVANPKVLSAIGWVVNGATLVALLWPIRG